MWRPDGACVPCLRQVFFKEGWPHLACVGGGMGGDWVQDGSSWLLCTCVVSCAVSLSMRALSVCAGVHAWSLGVCACVTSCLVCLWCVRRVLQLRHASARSRWLLAHACHVSVVGPRSALAQVWASSGRRFAPMRQWAQGESAVFWSLHWSVPPSLRWHACCGPRPCRAYALVGAGRHSRAFCMTKALKHEVQGTRASRGSGMGTVKWKTLRRRRSIVHWPL